jgi:hypothetical protein
MEAAPVTGAAKTHATRSPARDEEGVVAEGHMEDAGAGEKEAAGAGQPAAIGQAAGTGEVAQYREGGASSPQAPQPLEL